MPRYSESFKMSIMQKMMPPENQKVSTIAQETGMSGVTLYKWKKEAKAKAKHLERWAGKTRDWRLPEKVWLNPVKAEEGKDIKSS
ncbi:Transposase [Tindallia magadiensis]|uniref:Transposase n=1 Tax=Tindallia magadiensis TaxID=69895 RepID=A0A1I3I299_9FIRM|nr:transposase [Tindallia magadiensis]SFI41979.1 Transposase [Tindallia magadiensis]